MITPIGVQKKVAGHEVSRTSTSNAGAVLGF